MAAYLPAIERAGEMLDVLVRFLRRRRGCRRRAAEPDEEDAPGGSDSDSDSSSHTSVSSSSTSTSWDASLPEHPRPAPVLAPSSRPLTIRLPTLGRRGGARPPAPRKPAGLHITSLPPELQALILSHLPFADIQRLRRTCRFYRSLVTKSLLKDIYGPHELSAVLLSHCHLCHAHDPTRATLLYADITSPRYPFCSTCVTCAARRDELFAGRRVSMGNFRSAWVCRWCGFPVVSGPAWREPLFHQRCYSWYGSVLLLYLLLGWFQLCVSVIGPALCFRYFRGKAMVLAPCVISLVLAFALLFVLNVRSPSVDRTYKVSLAMELIILGLWIPPTYAISKSLTTDPPQSTVVTLSFCGINLTFRLMNVIGNILLISEPPLWRRNKPGLPRARRLLNLLVALLVFWTYPRAVEQSYQPRGEKERRMYAARRL